jgi:hypothetical protein
MPAQAAVRVGWRDMRDPALHAGVELGKGDAAAAQRVVTLAQMPCGVALARRDQ